MAMCTIQRLLLPGGEWGNHQSQVQAALTPEICTLCHHQTSQDSPATRWGGLYFIFFFIIFTTGLLPVATLELFFPQVEYSLFNPIKQEPLNPKIVLKSPRLGFFKLIYVVCNHSLILFTLNDRTILSIILNDKIKNYL